MKFIDSLCPPALLYLIYVVIHIGLDLSMGYFVTAAVKVVMGIGGVLILDALCSIELGIVSWAIIATPFLMVALASSIALAFKMDRAHLKEPFMSLSGDTLKNRDVLINPTFKDNAAPVSTSSLYE
uniref:Uncharacterized protein n=1 Tax=viral metagenome TaxID=1070528 RepID=A0A6C0JYK3_9ZZZZ